MYKKFRGETEGARVYGYYYVDSDGLPTIIDEDGAEFEVMESSVVQQVGYDKLGNELYEGDIVLDSDNMEYVVGLAMDYEIYFKDKSKEFVLKGAKIR